MSKWYEIGAQDSDVIISARLRIARNVKGYPFPKNMNNEQKKALNDSVLSLFANSEKALRSPLNCYEVEHLGDARLCAFLEKKLITEEFLEDKENKILFVSKDENISIMVGGRDHIRVVSLSEGISIDKAYERLNEIDMMLCEALPIAFDNQLGFLTSSPTELGTAMRVSVLLFLPALQERGEISAVCESVSKIGLSLNNLFGSYYLLSNCITLGITERGALENLNAIALGIADNEMGCREGLDMGLLEDGVFRAIGILKNARRITHQEAIELLSKIKLGAAVNMLQGIDEAIPFSLIIKTADAMIIEEHSLDKEDEINQKRAEIIRSALNY